QNHAERASEYARCKHEKDDGFHRQCRSWFSGTMSSLSPVAWPGSGGRTPKPSSPDQFTRPSYAAAPDGEVARTHALVWSSSSPSHNSHGMRLARPSSPTSNSFFV